MYSTFILVEKSIHADNYFSKGKINKNDPNKLIEQDNFIKQKKSNTKIINSLPTSSITK